MAVHERSAPWGIRALTVSFGVLFVLIVIASFMPGMRLWGVNHLAFYPVPVRLAALLLIALAFVPRIARFLCAMFSSALRPMFDGSKRGWAIAVLAVVAVAGILLLARVDTHLLGEGRFLAGLVTQGATTSEESTVGIGDVLKNERLAPGTMVLYLVASKLSIALSGSGMAAGIFILNLILFALFTLILFRFAVTSRMKPPAGALFLVVLVFSGTVVLFAGYLTKYAPFFIFASLYIVSAFRYLFRRGGFKAPLLLCMLAFTMHIFGVLLLPSFLYLLVHRLRGEPHTGQNRQIMIALLIVAIGIALAGAISPGIRTVYLPFLGTGETDGILSPGHIADMFNILLLALPALPLLLSVPTINRKLRQHAHGQKSSGEILPEDARARHLLESHFALLLLIPWMLFLLLFKPEVAFAREWDRYILSSLGVMPVMFVGLKRLLRLASAGTGGSQETTSSLAGGWAACIAPALIITLVMSLAWIGVNSSSQRSEARFEKLLGFEKKSAADGYEQLSFYYANQGRMLKAGDAAERAFELNPSPLNGLNLSMLYLAMEDTLRAIDKLTGSLQNDPSASMIRRQLITLLDQTGRYRELIQVSKAGTEREPDEPQYYYFLGKGYLYMGRLREGIEALKTCRDMNPPQPVLDNIEALVARIHKKQ